MAQEIRLQAVVSATKNGVTFNQSLTQVLDMAGDEMSQVVQDIGTTTEAITLSDVSTIGFVLVKNLDDTNYVELSVDNANAQKFAKLLPGNFALFPASAAFYATAHTATCKALVLALEL